MTYDIRGLARIRISLLLTAAAGWALLLTRGGMVLMPAYGSATHAHAMPISLAVLLAMNPPASMAGEWALMLIAMMSPALTQPVHHICVRSFTRRRARAIALFVAVYAGVWFALGGVFVAVALEIVRLAPQSYLPVAIVLLGAAGWQCSPLKQRCLNRCHAHPALAAFGAAADLDALRFGMTHAVWCAGSCWAFMLVPMLVPGGHLLAMGIVTALVFSERLERPRTPRWRMRGFGKASRIVIAQTRLRVSPVAPY
jgi:predicted metal-binding membrane protein